MDEAAIARAIGERSIVLVGMMGCGKSSVGRKLAQRLGRPFIDTDSAVEEAAQRSIAEIFATYGEDAFRSGERRVVKRVLETPAQVVALGGGAWVDNETREATARAGAISIWIDVEPPKLMERLGRRTHRPLLAGVDLATRIEELLRVRRSVYALADIRIGGGQELAATVQSVLEALALWRPPAEQSAPAKEAEERSH
ncbi:shikimate kinase [Terrarubrum flagellatum]|uniref:shikimate kinase n=1 Tax=Terrirubrum flagellatum TaxID=2895980 RepID=UPI003144EC20